ncbi:MAG: iron ABC transporter permease [Pseudomonadota bacterium]
MASICAAIGLGSDGWSPALPVDWLLQRLNDQQRLVVGDLRLPRALSAFAVGGLLALAGVLMQVLLRNPLADPYILGTSGGAATAALSAILLGAGVALVNLAAFAGACCATALVFGVGGIRSRFSPTALLLTGVVLGAGFGAVVSLLLAISPDGSLRGMLFWLMGDFSLALHPMPVWGVLTAATVAGIAGARHLNVLAEDEKRARLLGLPVTVARVVVLLAASLMTAFAVTVAGAIGFVGLVVPHLMRRFSGADHRWLVPFAALAGGSLLCVADALSRTVLAPKQLPVGTLTAAIGVPLFLYLLREQHRR